MSSPDESRQKEVLEAEQSIRRLAQETQEVVSAKEGLRQVENLLREATNAVSGAARTVRASRERFDERLDAHESNVEHLSHEIESRFKLSAEQFDTVAKEALQSALESVNVAISSVNTTRDHFDTRMDTHDGRVQELTKEVEKRFQLSAERFDASIDTLISVRRRIEEEADRLGATHGDILVSLQNHQEELIRSLESSRIETGGKIETVSGEVSLVRSRINYVAILLAVNTLLVFVILILIIVGF